MEKLSMITVEEFKNMKYLSYNDDGYEETNIECPVCKKPLFRYVRVVLSSYPPKHYYKCMECGFESTF